MHSHCFANDGVRTLLIPYKNRQALSAHQRGCPKLKK